MNYKGFIELFPKAETWNTKGLHYRAYIGKINILYDKEMNSFDILHKGMHLIDGVSSTVAKAFYELEKSDQ